jgi:hypothetical protein
MKNSQIIKILFLLVFVTTSYKFYEFYNFIVQESIQNTNTCMYFVCPVEKTIKSCFNKFNYSFFDANTLNIKEPFKTNFLVTKLANCVDRTYDICKEECTNVKIDDIDVSPRFYKVIQQNIAKYKLLEFESVFLTLIKKCKDNNLQLPCQDDD